MLATPHMLLGALIGKVTRTPWLSAPLGLASHFLLDRMPHMDFHHLLGIQGPAPTVAEVALVVTDVAVGAGLAITFSLKQKERVAMLAGAVSAIIIDLFDNVPPINHWFHSISALAPISHFHGSIQINVTQQQWPLGMGIQVMVVLSSLLVLWWIIRTKRPREN
jgi:hypothetical protein